MSCEDQGLDLISTGCRVCQYWEVGKTEVTRAPIIQTPKLGRLWWCCSDCGASYGRVSPFDSSVSFPLE